nr:MAG TPA: hypothetical protein [Caudoviricetes sp.]
MIKMMKDCNVLSDIMKFWWVAMASFCCEMLF